MPDGLIVAVGPNGEGKTNLLEGIHFLYALGSPRTSTNAPLVRRGRRGGLHARGVRDRERPGAGRGRDPHPGRQQVKVNRSPVRRKRDLRRQVRAVLFGPFDLPIVIGRPLEAPHVHGRGRDRAVAAQGGALHRLRPRLRQRNRLLKEWEGSGTPPGMEAWDEELIQAGSAVIQARAEAIDRLAPHASEEFVHLAGYELACTYAPNVWDATDLEQAFRDRIAERRRDELQRRTSLVGPHRDDLTLAVRDLGARAAGSHGETWATALCLRARPRHRGRRETRGAAGVPGGRPVQRARSHAPRSDRRAPRLASGPGRSSRWPTRPTSRRRRTPCGTCTPAP